MDFFNWLIELSSKILEETEYDIQQGEIEANCGTVYITKGSKTYAIQIIECEE